MAATTKVEVEAMATIKVDMVVAVRLVTRTIYSHSYDFLQNKGTRVVAGTVVDTAVDSTKVSPPSSSFEAVFGADKWAR